MRGKVKRRGSAALRRNDVLVINYIRVSGGSAKAKAQISMMRIERFI
jgi:hypothetical protein